MSEYWKSTPKYWCKFCKTFVKDTQLERQPHAATPRHQGNIQRSLRTLHKEKEKEDRETQRAKDEVARLNGVVSGKPVSGLPQKQRTQSSHAVSKQENPEARKRQLQQLADMGVVVPEEFRNDMAMAGDWHTVSERVVSGSGKNDNEDNKPGIQSFGVRKRKNEGAEEEDKAGETVGRKGWGSTTRRYPGAEQRGVEDIDALFKGKGRGAAQHDDPEEPTPVKKEETDDDLVAEAEPNGNVPLDLPIKHEEAAESAPVFKKRKQKAQKVA